MYILSTGCQWRYLPKDFPSYSTVHRYFVWWQCDGVLDRIHHALYVACREKAEREATPTAAIIGISLLATMKGLFPLLEKLFADSAYQGPLFAKALAQVLPRLETEIVKRSDHAKGFVRAVTQALDHRAHHRLAQPLPPSRQGLGKSQPQRPCVLDASIRLMLRKLCNP